MAKKVLKKAKTPKKEKAPEPNLRERAAGWHKNIARCGGELALALEARKMTRAQVLLWCENLKATANNMEMWINGS